MKIALLTYSANDSSAVTRLSNGLKEIGEDVSIFAIKASGQIKINPVKGNVIRRGINHFLFLSEKKLLRVIYPRKTRIDFDYSNYGVFNQKIINKLSEFDVINIHWINGMISYNDIRKITNLGIPVAWTMHDCWAFTGGCHHGCDNYKASCGRCFVLQSQRKHDFSSYVLKMKKKYFSDNIVIVSPSKWMKNKVDSSSLFTKNKSVCIHNGIPLDIFKSNCKDLNNYSKKIRILVGAMAPQSSPYKGYDELVETFRILSQLRSDVLEKIELCFFGLNCNENILSRTLNMVYKITNYGFIDDQKKLAKIYSEADFFLCTSIYDNLPTTLIESSACETPCISFDTGGINDIITHKVTGCLAPRKDCLRLAKGLLWCLENNEENILGKNARKKMQDEFNEYLCASNYLNLFNSMRK